jgi:hypothetical protein
MNILIIEADDRREFYLELCRRLSNESVSVIYFSYQGFPLPPDPVGVDVVLTTADFGELDGATADFTSDLRRAAALQSLLDRVYMLNLNVDTTTFIPKIRIAYAMLERIFDRYCIDRVLGDGEAEPFVMAAYDISEQRGVPAYSFNPISMIPGHAFLCPGGLINPKFQSVRPHLELFKPLSPREAIDLIRADRGINRSYFKHANWYYINHPFVYSIFAYIIRYLQLGIFSILQLLFHQQRADFFLGSRKLLGIRGLLHRHQRNIKRPFYRLLIRLNSKRWIVDKSSILVGLQYRPEASSSVMGHTFCSVHTFIDELTRRFPTQKLFFKDHPMADGYLPLDAFFRILLGKRTYFYDVRHMAESNFSHCVVNTSNLGFHFALAGQGTVDVLGNPHYKFFINTDANAQPVKSSEFQSYLNWCLPDNDNLPFLIKAILK